MDITFVFQHSTYRTTSDDFCTVRVTMSWTTEDSCDRVFLFPPILYSTVSSICIRNKMAWPPLAHCSYTEPWGLSRFVHGRSLENPRKTEVQVLPWLSQLVCYYVSLAFSLSGWTICPHPPWAIIRSWWTPTSTTDTITRSKAGPIWREGESFAISPITVIVEKNGT